MADLTDAEGKDVAFSVRRFRPDPAGSAPWANWSGAHHYRPGASTATIVVDARLSVAGPVVNEKDAAA